MITSEHIVIAIGAVVAFLLQVFIVPHIALFGGMAMPNLLVVFAMLVAVTRPQQYGPIMPFVFGLLVDFTTNVQAVGAMTFSLLVFSMLVARFVAHLNNDTAFVSLVGLALGLLLVELSYGVFLMLFGYHADLLGALAYRVVPCFLYDLFIALILYPVFARFLKPAGNQLVGISQLR